MSFPMGVAWFPENVKRMPGNARAYPTAQTKMPFQQRLAETAKRDF
jgi:hypothetical protein